MTMAIAEADIPGSMTVVSASSTEDGAHSMTVEDKIPKNSCT